jgi:archaellum component FlaC
VQIASLTPGEAPPMTRDERVAHHAQRLALEEELSESRARGVELHRAHEDVVKQLRTEKAKREAVDAELVRVKGELEGFRAQLAGSRKDHYRLQEEIRRLEAQQARTLPDAPR